MKGTRVKNRHFYSTAICALVGLSFIGGNCQTKGTGDCDFREGKYTVLLNPTEGSCLSGSGPLDFPREGYEESFSLFLGCPSVAVTRSADECTVTVPSTACAPGGVGITYSGTYSWDSESESAQGTMRVVSSRGDCKYAIVIKR